MTNAIWPSETTFGAPATPLVSDEEARAYVGLPADDNQFLPVAAASTYVQSTVCGQWFMARDATADWYLAGRGTYVIVVLPGGPAANVVATFDGRRQTVTWVRKDRGRWYARIEIDSVPVTGATLRVQWRSGIPQVPDVIKQAVLLVTSNMFTYRDGELPLKMVQQVRALCGPFIVRTGLEPVLA